MNTLKRISNNKTIEDRGYVTPCWIWKGYKDNKDRGTTRYDNKNVLVHRLIYELINGKTPLKICHRCDITSCFNPDHLFEGTQSDNMQDCVAKGRHPEAKMTHCKRGHEYNEENTYYRKVGGRKRQCRLCAKLIPRIRVYKSA